MSCECAQVEPHHIRALSSGEPQTMVDQTPDVTVAR